MDSEAPRSPVFKHAVVLCQGALVVLFSSARFSYAKPLLHCQGCVGGRPSRLPMQVHQQLQRGGECGGGAFPSKNDLPPWILNPGRGETKDVAFHKQASFFTYSSRVLCLLLIYFAKPCFEALF